MTWMCCNPVKAHKVGKWVEYLTYEERLKRAGIVCPEEEVGGSYKYI